MTGGWTSFRAATVLSGVLLIAASPPTGTWGDDGHLMIGRAAAIGENHGPIPGNQTPLHRCILRRFQPVLLGCQPGLPGEQLLRFAQRIELQRVRTEHCVEACRAAIDKRLRFTGVTRS